MLSRTADELTWAFNKYKQASIEGRLLLLLLLLNEK